MSITKDFQEIELHKEHKLLILSAFPTAFLLFGLLGSLAEYRDGDSLFMGMLRIILSPTTLLTDFMAVGGVSAAFFNSALIGFFNLYLLKRFKLGINGLLIAALLTVMGFSFFGKNVVNILPLYVGGWLYARYQRIPMKNVILVIMFSTALAPVVSLVTYGGYFQNGWNLVAGLGVGTGLGFVIVPLSSHMLRFHDGFNLYNIGFTAGVLGTVFTSILRRFDHDVLPVNILYETHNKGVALLLGGLFLYLMLVGFGICRKTLGHYRELLKHRGKTITDFTAIEGYGMTFFNMGLLGIMSLVLVLALDGVVNGPVIAGILTIVGFGAFGKHPWNCAPIVVGVMLGGLLYGHDFSSTTFLITVLFSTTIAPLAGGYGVLVGMLAGMLHLTMVGNVGALHGGINLYNNGFSGGIVAGVMVPVLDALRRRNE
ncbi:DUF1576 domain-containing protein [Anaerotalea alkaliphila]|uniref:DUF1576 domain-containing protein n=1 Tax=Anaerotalea alkaliphila TaxID=2662126 RepID=A0A7X5KMH7_9FIRM|nr:DUF1576 domain-containing protein [Anaerotalea alkaliphila]NDL66974.1 DUF1576 domain-containing protein [Anaerotalea alkaliphila]